MDKKFNAEYLRPVENIFEPDPRNTWLVAFDSEKGGSRPIHVRDYYEAVAQFTLNSEVPEDIVVQFETVKNLYLYAWFVYRFFPVAEHQAFVCLELALRKKYENHITKEYYKNSNRPHLRHFMRYAIDRGDIRNEGFRKWHKNAEHRAKFRYEIEKLDELKEKGLDQIELDYSEMEITDADRDWDYINSLLEYLPRLRNQYAHGTETLHNQVLGTIQVVSEIINQIYKAE